MPSTRRLAYTFTLLAGLATAGVMPAALATPHTPADDDTVKREGVGERGAALKSMELKPAPADLLASLTDWKNGDALTLESAKGRPVLVVTWVAWVPTSQQLVERVAEFAGKNPDLIVVLTHPERNYELATKWLGEKNITLRSARDTGGKLRAALKADAEPDLYFIDRAGNLRYADVETGSLATAVDLLISETADEAAKMPEAYAKALADARVKAGQTRDTTGMEINAGHGQRTVSFDPPPATAYQKALWPTKMPEDFVTKLGTNLQGQPLGIDLGPPAVWLTDKPDMRGKVVIVWFFATQSHISMNDWTTLEGLVRRHRDDLVVLGITGNGFDVAVDQKVGVERFLRTRPTQEFAHIYDVEQKIGQKLSLRLLHCLVVSTDGVVRFQGVPNQTDFQKVVENVIDVDPGVAARRKAEAQAAMRDARKP